MKDNETFEFENRTYINPDVSRDEQTAFIDTLRDIQAQNNAQIATETHNLGTDVEPIRGGLSGSEEYWKSLYQTPQTDATVANMKAVAQQSALNDALSNYQSMLQNRYNQAYRDYQKRAYNYSRKNSGSGSGTTKPTNDTGQKEGKTIVEYIKEISNNVVSKNRDAIYERKVQDETDRLMKEEGLNLTYQEARKQALANLGLEASGE